MTDSTAMPVAETAVPAPRTPAQRARAAWLAVRRAAARVPRLFRAVADKFPLTLLGVFAAVAFFLLSRYLGRDRQDVIAYVVGLGFLAVIAVAVVVVVIGTAILWWRVVVPPKEAERIEAGREIETGFTFPALTLAPLLNVRWEWLSPEGVAVEARLKKGRFVEQVVFHERGEHLVTVRRVIVEDVLGLARLAFTKTQPSPRTVNPALGRPLAAPLLEAFAAGDAISHPAGPPEGDLVDMRRYAVGDPMKRILWKVYARTRNVMVRIPERAIMPTRRTLAYLVSGEGDEAAAGVARLAVESESLGPEWRFSADQPEGAATSEDHDAKDARAALSLIVRSRAARLVAGEGLRPFLDRQGAWGGRCVVFAPGRAGRWLGAVEEEARRRPGQIEVVLGVDGVRGAGGTRADRWRRLFLHEVEEAPGGSSARVEEVERITKRLVGLGATVTVVDRPSGRLHGRSSRRRRA